LKTKIINLLESEIGACKLAEGKLICKFVLIVRNDELNLVFGPVSEYPFHANLVDEFCSRFGVPSGWSKKPDLVEIFDENCSISGGGWLEIEPAVARMKFSGRSTAYGRFGKSDLNHILTNDKLFSDYEVIVRH